VPAPQQAHIAGKPKQAMRIGAREVCVEHRPRDGSRIGLRQAAGPKMRPS